MKKIFKRFTGGLLLLLIYTGPGRAQSCDDNSNDVRILVAYTNAVAASSSNVLQLLIEPSINNINTAYQNSGIDHRVRLVRAVQVDYAETDNLQQSLNDFRYGEGPFSIIAAMKYIYHADVCVLITQKGNAAGIATGIGVGRSDAYCAVKNLFLVSRYTMAHEIGHLYGCRHEIALDATPGDNHGYVFTNLVDANGLRPHTIMAYGTTENGNVLTNPVPYFSNPSLNYAGEPLGNAGYANETKAINNGYNGIKGVILTEPVDIVEHDVIKANEVADVNAYGQITTTPGVNFIMEPNSTTQLRIEDNTGNIILRPGFHAKNGSTVRAYICAAPTTARVAAQPGKRMITGNPNNNAQGGSVNAWPNPFSNTVTVSYQLPLAQKVTLSLYNASGTLVYQALQGQLQQAGAHQYVFNGARLAAGIYIYRLQYGNETKTGRLVKLP